MFKIIVALLKMFSSPFRITKMLFTRKEQEEQDARKLMDVLKNKEDE